MARAAIATALAAASIALILIFHLAARFGLPELDFWKFHYESTLLRDASHQRILGGQTSEPGDLYLVGVGKADITGYGPSPSLCHIPR